MTDDGFRIERYGQVFVVDSGEPPFGSAASVGVVALAAIGFTALIAIAGRTSSALETAGIFSAFLLAFSPLFLIGSHRRTTEIDTAIRRLKISRLSFGRWNKTIVDCSLDECIALGTMEYDGAEGVAYGLYVQLKSGKRHGISSMDTTFKAAARIASQLSAATGIPRLDTKF